VYYPSKPLYEQNQKPDIIQENPINANKHGKINKNKSNNLQLLVKSKLFMYKREVFVNFSQG